MNEHPLGVTAMEKKKINILIINNQHGLFERIQEKAKVNVNHFPIFLGHTVDFKAEKYLKLKL